MQNALVLPFLALFPLAAPAVSSNTLVPAATDPCANSIPHEPLVLYEVNGGTLAGSVDRQLTVYSDGFLRLSSSLGDGSGFSQLVYVDPQQSIGLLRALVEAGAMAECDNDDFTSDVPLSSLTVLRGPARQRGNSFSWLGPTPSISVYEAILTNFIDAHFPNPPGGGSKF